MICISHYDSPLGRILLAGDEVGLCGLWLEGQRYFAEGLGSDAVEKSIPVLSDAAAWLDEYFSGNVPSIAIPLHIQGSPFRREVSSIMLSIPYGTTMEYGRIASTIAERHGVSRMSARAVGGAVGHNPISIIVPCHRVVGAGGNLTGYGGGLARKIALLELEGVDTSILRVPKRGTAL